MELDFDNNQTEKLPLCVASSRFCCFLFSPLFFHHIVVWIRLVMNHRQKEWCPHGIEENRWRQWQERTEAFICDWKSEKTEVNGFTVALVAGTDARGPTIAVGPFDSTVAWDGWSGWMPRRSGYSPSARRIRPISSERSPEFVPRELIGNDFEPAGGIEVGAARARRILIATKSQYWALLIVVSLWQERTPVVMEDDDAWSDRQERM